MKRFLALTILVAILACPLFVGAHGDEDHLLGTVTEATQDQITIKTLKGKSVTLAITADTTFQHNGIATKKARPQVGNRLIAVAEKDGDSFIAKNIKFSTPKSK